MEGSFAFSFVEGVLVKALREGRWVLLDEINLASAETLQRLSGLLEVLYSSKFSPLSVSWGFEFMAFASGPWCSVLSK